MRTKYGKDYHIELGKKIAELPGVWGVYFVLGEIDFIVLARFRNRNEFMEKYLEKLMGMPEVERSSTQVIVKTIKETLTSYYISPFYLEFLPIVSKDSLYVFRNLFQIHF